MGGYLDHVTVLFLITILASDVASIDNLCLNLILVIVN